LGKKSSILSEKKVHWNDCVKKRKGVDKNLQSLSIKKWGCKKRGGSLY